MRSFLIQLYYTVAREHGIDLTEPDKVGYVNQNGLSRKVRYSDDPQCVYTARADQITSLSAHLRVRQA